MEHAGSPVGHLLPFQEALTPPFQGMMFGFEAKSSPLEILTIELDVRTDLTTDFGVQVFTRSGTFQTTFSDESMWTKVFDGQGVATPNADGVVLPVYDFDPITVAANEAISFYVYMTGGAFLDHTDEALIKVGEDVERFVSDDFSMTAGFGFDNPGLFPATSDAIFAGLAPQFAGVFHYKKGGGDCEADLSVSSTFSYGFLPKSDAPMDALITDVSTIVGGATTEIMKIDGALQSYARDFNLSISNQANSLLVPYNGDCPANFASCPDQLIRTTVRIEHAARLSSGKVAHSLNIYGRALANRLRKENASLDFLYAGMNSVKANFDLVLRGTPDGVAPDPPAIDYLERTMSQYLDSSLGSDAVLLDLGITSSEAQRRLRRLQDGSLAISGNVLGLQGQHLSATEFAEKVNEEMVGMSEDFIDFITVNTIRPSLLTESETPDVFDGLTSLSGLTTNIPLVIPSSLGESSSDGGSFGLGIGALVGIIAAIGLVALVCGFFLVRWVKERREYSREVDEYRKKMKAERKERRKAKEQRRPGMERQNSWWSRSSRENKEQRGPGMTRQNSWSRSKREVSQDEDTSISVADALTATDSPDKGDSNLASDVPKPANDTSESSTSGEQQLDMTPDSSMPPSAIMDASSVTVVDDTSKDAPVALPPRRPAANSSLFSSPLAHRATKQPPSTPPVARSPHDSPQTISTPPVMRPLRDATGPPPRPPRPRSGSTSSDDGPPLRPRLKSTASQNSPPPRPRPRSSGHNPPGSTHSRHGPGKPPRRALASPSRRGGGPPARLTNI